MNIHSVHSSSPHYTLSPESPFGTPVFGIPQWDLKLAGYRHALAYTPREKACERPTAVCQADAGTGHLVPSARCIHTCCGNVPVSRGYQGNGVASTALLFLLKSLSSLSLTILSEVSLHSDFKFRQVYHWLLKHSVHCKTRLSCSDTLSHLLQHAQPCF